MLNSEIKEYINSQVDEMLKFLEFIECVEQINDRFAHYDQIGYGINLLVRKTRVKSND